VRDTISIKGKQIGRKRSDRSDIKHFDIVHIEDEFRPVGPAENSIVMVSTYHNGKVSAKYIPFVGYFDLDRQKRLHPENWKIIEPSTDFLKRNVLWAPFGNEQGNY
jgi:hypothetical protein